MTDARDAALGRIQARRAMVAQLLTMLGVAVAATVIWLLTGRGYFWPGWVYFGLAFSVVGILSHAYSNRGVSEDQISREMQRS